MTYKLINANTVRRLSDGASIPFDPANVDYVEYLKWIDAGNAPQPPDSAPTTATSPARDRERHLKRLEKAVAKLPPEHQEAHALIIKLLKEAPS